MDARLWRAILFGFVSQFLRVGGGTRRTSVAGLRSAFYLLVVFLALVFDSPLFLVLLCSRPQLGEHYTRLFNICQMLNEINRGYLPQKGTKEILP